MKAHEIWLLQSSTQLQNADNIIQYLTMFLPGQSHRVELGSEVAASALALVNTYRDALVTRLERERGLPQRLQVRFLEAQPHSYHWIATALALIRSVELLMEMTARHRSGESGRRKTVLGVESTKAALRLLLLAISRRPLPYPTLPEPELDAAEVEALVSPDLTKSNALTSPSNTTNISSLPNQQSSPDSLIQEDELDSSWVMPRTGKSLQSPTSSMSASQLLESRVLDPDTVRYPGDLLRPLTSRATCGEVLSILRPVIYAALLYRTRYSRHKWTPWIIAAATEYIARRLSSEAYGRSATGLEKEQLRAKSSSLWWWSLRGAFYDRITRPVAGRIVAKLSRIPIINFGTILAEDYLYLLDTYHFASASY